MAAITAKNYIETQLSHLNPSNKEILQNIKQGKELQESIKSIQDVHKVLSELHQSCTQVEEKSRPAIMQAIGKMSAKLDFGEKLANYLLESSAKVDPRVEKIFAKIKSKPLPRRMDEELAGWQAKLSSWHQKLDQLSNERPNLATASEAEKAKAMLTCQMAIVELRKEAFPETTVKTTGVQADLKKNEAGIFSVDARGSYEPVTLETSATAYAIEPVPKEKILLLISSFEKIITALSEQSQEKFFQEIVSAAKCVEVSPVDKEVKYLLGAICFNLNYIQNNETPDKIDQTDSHWRSNALLSNLLSTIDQKVRAVQRVQVGTLLKLLLLSLEREDKAQTSQLLDVLEHLKLDSKDLPGGPKNVAHKLFGKLYAYHVDERKKNLSLEDPDDQKFGVEFGRLAFHGIIKDASPDSFIKAALKEVCDDLNTLWTGTWSRGYYY